MLEIREQFPDPVWSRLLRWGADVHCLMLDGWQDESQRDQGGTEGGAVTGARWRRFHPVSEYVGRVCLPLVQSWTECELYPSFSTVIEYTYGDVIQPHRDGNPSAQWSLVLMLSLEGVDHWDLHYRQIETVQTAFMRPGMGIIFCSSKWEHWRDALEGTRAVNLVQFYTALPHRECVYSDEEHITREESMARAYEGLRILWTL